ncbi:MAG: hypothetical protein WCB27_03250, partial [Thermoguttaceae bacterium]
MTNAKTAYELSQSQVTTPVAVVKLFWRLTNSRRPHLGSVLDMGAGDCRFATGGQYKRYVGVEIDAHRAKAANVPRDGRLQVGCVFQHRHQGYDACIGNPIRTNLSGRVVQKFRIFKELEQTGAFSAASDAGGFGNGGCQ